MDSCFLNDACQPLLTQIVALEALNDLSKEQALHKLQHQIKQMQARALAHECPDQDVQDASYALCALVDEQVPLRCPQLCNQWRSALLQALFGENRGGEHFFERLDRVLEQPTPRASLRIFGLCLAHGFRGKFSENGHTELAKVRQRVRRQLPTHPLATGLCSTHSPAKAPESNLVNHARWVWPTAVALCLVLIGVASLRRGLDQTSESLLRQLPKVLDPVELS